MQMVNNNEFSVTNRVALGAAMHGATPLIANAQERAQTLSEVGINDTAELIARLAARLMRQEQLLLEERKRSAALELQLASKHSIFTA